MAKQETELKIVTFETPCGVSVCLEDDEIRIIGMMGETTVPVSEVKFVAEAMTRLNAQ